MGRFDRVWAGDREPRLRPGGEALSRSDEEPAVAAFRTWTNQLMTGAAAHATPRTVDLRKLRLTEGFREALRQAPAEQTALFGIWDAAYRQLERLTWELAPPAIDPPRRYRRRPTTRSATSTRR